MNRELKNRIIRLILIDVTVILLYAVSMLTLGVYILSLPYFILFLVICNALSVLSWFLRGRAGAGKAPYGEDAAEDAGSSGAAFGSVTPSDAETVDVRHRREDPDATVDMDG